MATLIVVIAVAALAFAYVRGTQRNRLRWLERLDLPGIWHWEGHDGTLELAGSFEEGHYRFREPEGNESGRWALQGQLLVLTPESGSESANYDVRLFDEGKIGVDGPGRSRRIYVKEHSNVVPLRRKL